jgi:FSR family fosmidomycin resistance protein-like MFS transporter
MVHVSYVAFISILGQGRGWSTGKIGWAFSAYLVASTLGRIVGGYAGDHVSPRKILALSSALAGIMYLGFCSTVGAPSLALLFLAGFCFELGSATNVVLAQRVLPASASAATGLVMGFAWGTAGILVPLMGRLAEVTSLPFTLALASTLLFPAAALVAFLAAARPPGSEADLPPC